MANKKFHPARFLCSWILMLVFVFSMIPAMAEEENLLANGDFSKKGTGWGVYKESGGAASFKAEALQGVLSITKAGQKDYSVQLFYDGFGLEKGGQYRLAFTVTSSIARQIRARVQKNGGDYFGYAVQDVALEADKPTRVEVSFTMEKDSDPAPRLCFNAGKPQDGPEYASHTLTFESVELTLADGAGIVKDAGGKEAPAILVNQIGYQTTGPKVAFFRDGALGEAFEVVDQAGKTVYAGRQTAPIDDPASGDQVSSGDFGAVTAPGTYQVRAGDYLSPAFAIGENVYGAAFLDVLRFLYYQRCGTALTKDLAGDFAHPACHTGLATMYGTAETKDVPGGWHDAGDYGRYVVPAAKTVADLLLAYEANPALFLDHANIPESGNGIPDVLDEVRYELDWLLKMQDEKAGGVYHKASCAAFPGFVMPDQEKAPLIISPISTAATGDFAAVMALAARIYEKTNSAYSQTLLMAAQKAWAYLEANPGGGTGFHNPEGISTGEYGDGNDTDERYWAAAELACATQRDTYAKAAAALHRKNPPSGLGWQAVGTYGDIALLRAGAIVDADTQSAVKADVLHAASMLAALAGQDGYHMTLKTDYPWGSNMTVANNGLYLMLAASISPGDAQEFTNLARQHMDYLMGANPMGYCYITGHGTLFPASPHHRPSQAAGKTVPGMLAGGPNVGLDDPYAKAVLTGRPAAKCYVDNDQSYSTNEVTIYWNSPLLYLMALLVK